MQITADSMGVYTKVFSLSLYQNFDVIRQWSVQWCLMTGPACLLEMNKRRIQCPAMHAKDNVLFNHCYLKRSTVKVKFSLRNPQCNKVNMDFYLLILILTLALTNPNPNPKVGRVRRLF